ncbi:MAG TPA: peptidoglycan DD-metalloendopeptidase family protein [Gemmatimonadaceae bacterium]|nr:peptidoglycan DD-metalloendopeptidase family protein [Gemmatimonadaceae bacterium]
MSTRHAAAALVVVALALPAAAQNPVQQADAKLRAERAHLDSLRAERTELERRRVALQSTVHDLSEELDNVNREVQMTASVVETLDNQLAAINADVSVNTSELARAQDELEIKNVVLQQRLVDIYKRGRLYESEVLLSASSFADLVARYKYLHLAALRDQALVKRVEDLRKQIDHQRENLVRFQEEIQMNLSDKAEEERRLRNLQEEQASSLQQTKQRARETDRRLAVIAADEQKLTDVITSLEKERQLAERQLNRKPPPSSLATKRASGGTLDWPVPPNTIIYSFGRVVNPDNTTVRWNGIGIAAPAGTEVHAISAGRVVVAEPLGTYGLTVIIQHSGGDYTVYGSLGRLATRKGDVVNRGQLIGYVGTSDPELPSHLHFELRPEGRAVDPLDYLKPNNP